MIPRLVLFFGSSILLLYLFWFFPASKVLERSLIHFLEGYMERKGTDKVNILCMDCVFGKILTMDNQIKQGMVIVDYYCMCN